MTTYPQTVALTQLYRHVERRFRIKFGPMYFGELEAMVLTPLRDALQFTKQHSSSQSGLIVKYAYQLSAEYAIIAEIAQISQVKEVARELTASAIYQSPVYQAFVRDKNVANSDSGKVPNAQDKVSAAWRYIDDFLADKMSMGDSQGEQTPLSILLTLQTEPSSAEQITSTWQLLVRHLKEGKGRPLSQSAASDQAMSLTITWNAICDLYNDAIRDLDSRSDGQVPTRASFADAWTALMWFDAYLQMVEQYDALFPAAVMQQQSTAWVLALRNQALKYRGLFSSLSKAAQSFDITTFMWLWDQQWTFVKGAIPAHLLEAREVEAMWKHLKDLANQAVEPFASKAALSSLDEYKSYLDVDVLLPSRIFNSMSYPVSSWTVPDPNPTKSGKSLLESGDTLGLQDIYSGERMELFTNLAAAAGMLEVALGYLLRSQSLLSGTNNANALPLLPSADRKSVV